VTYTGQFEDLLTDNTSYQRAITLNDYFNKEILNAANTAGFATKINGPDSKSGYWQVTDTKNWEAFKDVQSAILADRAPEALAEYWESKTGAVISSAADLKIAARGYLDGMLPDKEEIRTITKPTGGGSGNGTKKGVRVSKTEQNVAYDDSSINVRRSKISNFVSGSPVEMSKSWTMTKSGKNIAMIPKYVEERPDGMYISGDSYVDTETGIAADDAQVEIAIQMGSLGTVKIKSADGTTERTFERKPVSAPIKGNEGTVESMLEGTNYNAIFGAQQQPAGGAGETGASGL
jgi:hypothetical protein